MKQNYAIRILSLAGLIAPLAASAANFSDFLDQLTTNFINPLIPFLIAVATLIFIFGVVRYITAAGDEEKTKEGRKFIIYGIIGLAIIVLVWGFVNILINSLNLDTSVNTGTQF